MLLALGQVQGAMGFELTADEDHLILGLDMSSPLQFLIHLVVAPWAVKTAIAVASRDRPAVWAALVMISAWLRVCAIGQFSVQGMPSCLAWSVAVELLILDRMSPMSSGGTGSSCPYGGGSAGKVWRLVDHTGSCDRQQTRRI
jgi:hypothetical protein